MYYQIRLLFNLKSMYAASKPAVSGCLSRWPDNTCSITSCLAQHLFVRDFTLLPVEFGVEINGGSDPISSEIQENAASPALAVQAGQPIRRTNTGAACRK